MQHSVNGGFVGVCVMEENSRENGAFEMVNGCQTLTKINRMMKV